MNERPDLDLFSISPNFGLMLLSQPETFQQSSPRNETSSVTKPKCIYANVWFAYQIQGKTYGLAQGNCNHWDCPRCGQLRAKEEYARIVHGIHELSLAGHDLYFTTLTCRGRTLTYQEAEEGYLGWTNRLLDAYRARVKAKGGHWVYVQATERQKRKHPHSHILSTFQPFDLVEGSITKWRTIAGIPTPEQKAVLRSAWLHKAMLRSGLGEQYDISRVRNEAAASRYVAKYMFKPSAFTADWPAHWRRVRYSQSFPKLPELKTDAFVLRNSNDWDYLARSAVVLNCPDDETFAYAKARLWPYDVVVRRMSSS